MRELRSPVARCGGALMQRHDDLPGRLKALAQIAFQELHRDRIKVLRYIGTDDAGPWDVAPANRSENLGERVLVEQLLVRQKLPQHHADRPQVRAPIDLVAGSRLLWRHVSSLALDELGALGGRGLSD